MNFAFRYPLNDVKNSYQLFGIKNDTNVEIIFCETQCGFKSEEKSASPTYAIRLTTYIFLVQSLIIRKANLIINFRLRN